MTKQQHARIHATAEVHPSVEIGEGSSIWNQCQVRENVKIGRGCILGKDVYVDFEVKIGDNVKIQNGSMLYHGLAIESGVFIGPGVIFTNDKRPRAINPDGLLKTDADWEVGETTVHYGASIGAGAIILPGLMVGQFAMVGAGALVTRNIPAHGMVLGNPARLIGYVCKCGEKLTRLETGEHHCPTCQLNYSILEG
jgi:acetyltransferase-like isoleucine patch superfamily enzyme